MHRWVEMWRRLGKRAVLLAPMTVVLLLTATAREHEARVVLLPQLHNGETLAYESHALIDRHVETRSNVATMLRPAEVRRDISTVLRLTIHEARLIDNKLLMAGETVLEPTERPSATNAAAKSQNVSFTIGGDGGITRAEGLDDLDPEQRLSWQFWVAQFAYGWTLPTSGVKPGEKWKEEETEKTPAPIANLAWERETTYVQNENCPASANEECAVFLIASTLKQKSNPKDTTPEEYQLRQLKTSGTAKGTNETVVYLSLRTGLLMRATEDLQQFMTVTIAKADDSNEVHYDVQVTSHFETTFVPQR